MNRSSDSQPDISCMSIMDKFGLASPTRSATAVRYRPSSSASPSHLHHLLRSHSNASSAAAAAEADMRAERREDGDGRSCDSIAAACVVGLVPVSETATTTATATTTVAATATSRQQATPHHSRHHHLTTAAESDDDDDDDELTERRRRRLRLLNTTTTPAATADITTTDDDDKCRSETFGGATDSGSVGTVVTLSTPLLQQRQRQWDEDVGSALVHSSSVKISTQPSFSQVTSSSLHFTFFVSLSCKQRIYRL